MENSLENMSREGNKVSCSSAEEKYLSDVKSSCQSEKYSCVTGCSNCVSCGGND